MEYSGVEALPKHAGTRVARMAASRNRFTSEASDEAARAENPERIKHVLDFLHLREAGVLRSPDFQVRFPCSRAVRNCRLTAKFIARVIHCVGRVMHVFSRFLTPRVRQEHKIDDPEPSRKSGPGKRI